jgi:hypothetical protein
MPLNPEPAAPPPVVENVVSFIPAPVSFKGMPNPRFWMMEENFLRDEAAAMVWAVEDRVPSQAGKGVSGDLMAQRSTAPPPFVPAGNAAIQYVLGTTVPDNWIPFIPVHIQGSITEIQFQRAAMPGAKGALGEVIKEQPAPYYIQEEEIPRAGIIVKRGTTRARWLGGDSFVWMARTKETGTGEGWSNLKFDQIVPIPGGGQDLPPPPPQ